MSMFKHDDRGFLVGELIDTSRELLATQRQSLTIWRGVRSDVAAIARAMGVQSRASRAAPAVTVRSSRSAPSAAPSASLAGVGPVATPAGRGGARPAPAAVAAARTRARTEVRPVAVVQPRGANGRFQRGEGKGAGGRDGDAAGGAALKDAAGRLSRAAGALGTVAGSMENVDATIAASKEVAEVVAPLGRGLFGLFGRNQERKRERWYARFWKSLKVIEKKDKGNNGSVSVSSGGGFLGTLLGSLMGGKGRGLLGRILGLGAAAGGAGGAGRGVMRLLKKVPLLGALLSGGSALFSAFGGEDDANASPEENRSRRYHNAGQAVGMGVGGAVGGLVGSIFGPAGMLAGGYLGALLGEKVGGAVGDWTKSLIDSGIPGKIVAYVGAAWDSLMTDLKSMWDSVATVASSAWNSFTTDLKTAWEGISKAAKDAVDAASSAANTANEWIKEKTGIDVKGAITSAVDKAVELRDAARAKVAEGAKWLGNRAYEQLVPETVKRAGAAGVAAAQQVGAGYTAARGGETAAPAPSTGVQRAARGVGEAAGGLGNMIAKHEGGYGSFNRGNAGDSRGATMDFAGMSISEIMAAQALPKGDANRLFAVGKYQVIPSTLKAAVKGMGLSGDEKFTPEMQERIFAEYLTDKKRPAIAGYIKGQHNDLGRAQLAGAQEWASIADPKTGKSYYAGSGNNRAGLSADKFGAGLGAARAAYQRLIAQGVDEGAAYATALRAGGAGVTATSAAPRVPAANIPPSTPPAVPPTPADEVPNRLNSTGGSGPVQVSINDRTTQDVSNRRIANLASGGISSA